MRQRLFMIFLSACCSGGMSWADPEICEEYWYTRNAIFDRAGLCFTSALGKAEFDNADCVSGGGALGAAQADQVAQIRTYEGHFSCDVDSGARGLGFADKALLQRLSDLPVRGFDGSDLHPVDLEYTVHCITWLGREPLLLRAGTSDQAPVVGAIHPGDDVSSSHHALRGWTYFVSEAPGGMRQGGWAAFGFEDLLCEAYAG